MVIAKSLIDSGLQSTSPDAGYRPADGNARLNGQGFGATGQSDIFTSMFLSLAHQGLAGFGADAKEDGSIRGTEA